MALDIAAALRGAQLTDLTGQSWKNIFTPEFTDEGYWILFNSVMRSPNCRADYLILFKDFHGFLSRTKEAMNTYLAKAEEAQFVSFDRDSGVVEARSKMVDAFQAHNVETANSILAIAGTRPTVDTRALSAGDKREIDAETFSFWKQYSEHLLGTYRRMLFELSEVEKRNGGSGMTDHNIAVYSQRWFRASYWYVLYFIWKADAERVNDGSIPPLTSDDLQASLRDMLYLGHGATHDRVVKLNKLGVLVAGQQGRKVAYTLAPPVFEALTDNFAHVVDLVQRWEPPIARILRNKPETLRRHLRPVSDDWRP